MVTHIKHILSKHGLVNTAVLNRAGIAPAWSVKVI